tara:strand:- start:302 stop:505 length:204 start_codon:yes stop_codon:yes gene_type:complete
MPELHSGESLNFEDIQILRRIVKKVHFKNYPKEMITNKEADKFIYSLTPKITEALIKTYVDGKFDYK